VTSVERLELAINTIWSTACNPHNQKPCRTCAEPWLLEILKDACPKPLTFIEAEGDEPQKLCACGTVDTGIHEFARHPRCEYHHHHCEHCHERRNCTLEDCGFQDR
jgi:hypothetical protein